MASGDREQAGSNREARLAALYGKLNALDIAPYWAVGTEADHDEDAQILKARKAEPFLWKYRDIEPILYESAELVSMEDSERRSVVLVNPGMAPVRATVSTAANSSSISCTRSKPVRRKAASYTRSLPASAPV